MGQVQIKILIVGDFNMYVDNEKDALGSAFIDILNSIGVRQHVSGPTHCRNHTLDLIAYSCFRLHEDYFSYPMENNFIF